LLTNLKLTHAKKRDYPRSLAAAERIQMLDPQNWRNLSDLARLQAEVGDFIRAVDTLSAFLDRAPEGADTKKAQDALSQLRELARKQASAEPS
jgi:regulator of sirC expression with transglutaminase-like and TPR domain